MRADRLLSILLHLQVHRRITACELAKRLEVSERTIYRDMEALGAAGVPVVAERGTGGGWALLEEYKTNLTGLNEAEIQTLFLTQPARLLADLGLRQTSEAALIKLLASLPSISRRGAEYIRQRIHVDVTGWHHTEETIAALPILQEAIWRERELQFTYQRNDGKLVERLAAPLGLVAKGSVWYLVAIVEQEIRSYRVSRIRDAAITDQPYTRPQGFDLAQYWSQSSASFVASLPRYPAILRMTAAAFERIPPGRQIRVEHAEPSGADGWITARVLFETEDSACGYILSHGAQIEVVEPLELRERVISIATSVVAFYTQELLVSATSDIVS
ncbi:MAG TPA: YafY family protein [Ktedonosporobacter sp.]|jgi:predicted DNA-binding transcriptional regulator YafY|nr:YafY family protein [Ktedonosporobacter sp.]